jgi:hypothetical protein
MMIMILCKRPSPMKFSTSDPRPVNLCDNDGDKDVVVMVAM